MLWEPDSTCRSSPRISQALVRAVSLPDHGACHTHIFGVDYSVTIADQHVEASDCLHISLLQCNASVKAVGRVTPCAPLLVQSVGAR
jgi:hypothetical protein